MINQVSLFFNFLTLLSIFQTKESGVVSSRAKLFFRSGKTQKSPSPIPVDFTDFEVPETAVESETIADDGADDLTEELVASHPESLDLGDSLDTGEEIELDWDPIAKEQALDETLEKTLDQDALEDMTTDKGSISSVQKTLTGDQEETLDAVDVGADGENGADGNEPNAVAEESGEIVVEKNDLEGEEAIDQDIESAVTNDEVGEAIDQDAEPVAAEDSEKDTKNTLDVDETTIVENDLEADDLDEETVAATPADDEEDDRKPVADLDGESEESDDEIAEDIEEEEERADDEILAEKLDLLSEIVGGLGTVTDPSGKLAIIWKFDGGMYEGQVGVVSITGMENYDLNSIEFMEEAIRRALANIIVDDTTSGAEFSEPGAGDMNKGAFTGEKIIQLQAGEQFFLAVIPNGTFADILASLEKGEMPNGNLRPLFSLATANPEDSAHFVQLVDLNGAGTFAIEDIRSDAGSDWDLNDLVIKIKGADIDAPTVADLIEAGVISEAPKWIETDLGKAVLAEKGLPGAPIHTALPAPTVAQTTVDQGGNGFADLTGVNNTLVEPNRGGALPNTPTAVEASSTQDIIDQVSSIDPTDVYQVASQNLKQAEISVLSGSTSVSLVTLEGEVLSQKVLGRGTHAFTIPDNVSGEVLLKFDNHGGTNGTYILKGFESQAEEPFNIDLEFTGGVTASQQEVIRAAAKSIEALIGKGLPSAIVDGKIIDDVNFQIAVKNLDGAGGTLAQTKIDFMRYGTMLPAQSITQFDVNDIAELEKSGELFSVVQHEILHGLGFGNLWEAKGLVDYAGTPLAQYNGQQAVAAFKEVGGLTDAISLETVGDGSAGLHWNKMLFQNELMTRDLGFQTGEDGQVISPISTVTLAALADLGYRVNLNKATPNWGLFGGSRFKSEDLTSEQIEAFRKLAEVSFVNQSGEFIPAILPMVDPDKVAPEIWAHAERAPDGEYYDWEDYRIVSGDTLSELAQWKMGSGSPSNYWWIANHNGIPNPDFIVTGDIIKLPVHRPDYEKQQEAERLKKEQELKDKQDQEAKDLKDKQDNLDKDKFDKDQEELKKEADAKEKELEEQAKRIAEELEKKRQHEEWVKEQERLAELARLAEIARQQGKGGQEWFFSKSLPEFGPVDPFETSMIGETVGNLVPDDYYRFTLSRGGRITADLIKLLADADLVLYDVRNKPIAWSMREGVTDEQIITDLIPGTYMLRVNSPKGVTTDYDLIVKFQHLLSATQKGPPPGWKVGGNNGGGGGGSTTSPGVTFADPRIKGIYDKALGDFAEAERAKANTTIAGLEQEKRTYEQQLKDKLAQINSEQREKILSAIDGLRDGQRTWVDNQANPIKNTIDSSTDWILGQIDNNIPKQVYDAWGIGDRLRSAKDDLKGKINEARSWLKGKIDGLQTQVKDAIWQFAEQLKNAYMTGAEINGAIERLAQDLKRKIDSYLTGINDLVGQFKGEITKHLQGLRNVGVDIPEIKDWWGNTITSGFKWNFYDSVVEPLANNLANSVKDKVNSAGDFANSVINNIKPLAQGLVAEIVSKFLGDETGKLYNKIEGVDKQIANINAGVVKAINNQAAFFKGLLDDFTKGLGQAGDFVIGALMGEFNDNPSIWQTLLDSVVGMIPIVGEIGDVRDLIAFINKFSNNPDEMKDFWNWLGVVGALVGLVPVAGGAIKGVTKIARNADFIKEINKLGPAIVKAIGDFARKNWDETVQKSTRFFDKIITTIGGLIQLAVDGIRRGKEVWSNIGKSVASNVDQLLVFLSKQAENLGKLRDAATTEIKKSFDWLKSKLDDLVKSGSGFRIPYGFKSAEQFQEFGTTIYSGFSKAGYNDVEAIVQGSAATGIKFETRLPITSPSDFDIAIVSPSLFDKAEALGVKPRGATNQPRILLSDDYDVKLLGLDKVKNELNDLTDGIPSNFLIFKSREDAIARAESSAATIGIDPNMANILVPKK